MKRIFLTLAAIVAMPVAAFSADEVTGRYQLKEAEGGVVRLDTATGDMTFCKVVDNVLECSGASQSTSLSPEISCLKARVEKLEREAALQQKLPGANLPTDEEVNRSLSIMEKFMRSFMGMVEELDKKNNEEETLPQKT